MIDIFASLNESRNPLGCESAFALIISEVTRLVGVKLVFPLQDIVDGNEVLLWVYILYT